MRLDPEIKQQVEAVLKSPVPSPTDPEFDELLLRLRKENPELADLLESGILFDDLPTPEEETQRAVARRSWLLTLKHRLLDRYDELTGEWVPSRPKQIAVGFAGLIAATTLWFILSTRDTEPAKGGLPVPVPTATTTTAPQPEPGHPLLQLTQKQPLLEGQPQVQTVRPPLPQARARVHKIRVQLHPLLVATLKCRPHLQGIQPPRRPRVIRPQLALHRHHHPNP